jgi:hypothetical protein
MSGRPKDTRRSQEKRWELVDSLKFSGVLQGRRRVAWFERGELRSQVVEEEPELFSKTGSFGVRSHLVELARVGADTWVEGTLERLPFRKTGWGGPKLEGYLGVGGGEEKKVLPVQSIDEPAASLVAWGANEAGLGGLLIWDDRGARGGARKLMEEEVASMLRVSPKTLTSMRELGADVRFSLGSTVPWEMAEALLERCARRAWRQEADALRETDDEVGVGEEASIAEEGDRRRARGGPRRVGRDKPPRASIESLVSVLLGSSIGEGSTATYSTAFKHWVEWRAVRRKERMWKENC